MWCFLWLGMMLTRLPAGQPVELSTKARRSVTIKDSDWFLTNDVRRALWEDKDLAPLNLEVIIENGAATLYGPVPSQYFGERAELVVEQVKGIEIVHNQLRIRYLPYDQAPRTRQNPSADQIPTIFPGRP